MPAHPAAETRWELATPHQSALAKARARLYCIVDILISIEILVILYKYIWYTNFHSAFYFKLFNVFSISRRLQLRKLCKWIWCLLHQKSRLWRDNRLQQHLLHQLRGELPVLIQGDRHSPIHQTIVSKKCSSRFAKVVPIFATSAWILTASWWAPPWQPPIRTPTPMVEVSVRQRSSRPPVMGSPPLSSVAPTPDTTWYSMLM